VQNVQTVNPGRGWCFPNLLGGGVLDKVTDLSAVEFATGLSFVLGP
jgi:hypothetical protein